MRAQPSIVIALYFIQFIFLPITILLLTSHSRSLLSHDHQPHSKLSYLILTLCLSYLFHELLMIFSYHSFVTFPNMNIYYIGCSP
jgi:hypothetical protein